MNLLKKIAEYIAPTTSEMFREYVKYFNTAGMNLKVGRGAIRVTHNGVTKEYTSWNELNEEYKLFPTYLEKVDALLQPILLKKHWTISSNMFNDVVVMSGDQKIGIYLNKFDLAYDLGLTKFCTPKGYIKSSKITRTYRMYAYGSKVNNDKIAEIFNKETNSNSFTGKMFNAPERIYYINSWGHLCSTKDSFVMDILENDDCWYNIADMIDNENKNNK